MVGVQFQSASFSEGTSFFQPMFFQFCDKRLRIGGGRLHAALRGCPARRVGADAHAFRHAPKSVPMLARMPRTFSRRAAGMRAWTGLVASMMVSLWWVAGFYQRFGLCSGKPPACVKRSALSLQELVFDGVAEGFPTGFDDVRTHSHCAPDGLAVGGLD